MKNNKVTSSQGNFSKVGEYKSLLLELRSIISKGQYAAYKSVDNIKVQTYWQLGERIVREELKYQNRADYGQYLIEKLAVDLRMSMPELYKIVKFFRCYEIVSTVSRELSWNHYIELIGIENDSERLFYQHKAVINSWGVRDLRSKIKSQLYEGTSMLEKESVLKIGGKMHHIDLVLYHKGIPCNILVDLKIGKIDAGDIGQMNKYVSYWRRNKQYAHEKDAIGLIICRESNREEIMYALGGLERKIFVSEYQLKLPSEAKIIKAFRRIV